MYCYQSENGDVFFSYSDTLLGETCCDGCHNILGKRVERTKGSYPYSYDPFAVYKSPDFDTRDSAIFSDRMREWDGIKYKRCVEETWPKDRRNFSACKSWEIQKFLRLYLDKEDIELTGIEEACNFSSGYPYWVFYYKDKTNL